MATIAAVTPRGSSWSVWLARGMWLAAIAMIGVTGFLLISYGHVASGFVHDGAGSVELVSLMFASVGLVIATKQPWNRIGWMLLAVGLLYAAISPSDAYFQP